MNRVMGVDPYGMVRVCHWKVVNSLGQIVARYVTANEASEHVAAYRALAKVETLTVEWEL